MKLTKTILKQLIKETFQDTLEGGADLHDLLQEITWWMEENGVYEAEKGIIAWLQYHPEHEDKRKALLGMSKKIYDYMG
jgi:hypothetical protein